MKAFLDTGFLLSLILEMTGSRAGWQITRRLEGPLHLCHFQRFQIENRLLREIENPAAKEAEHAGAAAALQNLKHYLDEQFFQTMPIDYDIALHLAGQWQSQLQGRTPPALLLLWPALAVTAGATHFLSFDPRPRQLAQIAGLKLLPERL